MRWPWERQGSAIEAPQEYDAYKKVAAELPFESDTYVLNTHSGTWRFIRHFLAKEIEALRERNDKLSLDAGATAAIRGQIKMAKRILELENDTGPDKSEVRSQGYGTDIFGPDRSNK